MLPTVESSDLNWKSTAPFRTGATDYVIPEIVRASFVAVEKIKDHSTQAVCNSPSVFPGPLPVPLPKLSLKRQKLEMSLANMTQEQLTQMAHEAALKGKRAQCPYCYQWFFRKSDLKRHETVHTGERPFECGVCHKRFARRCTLKNHTISVHLKK